MIGHLDEIKALVAAGASVKSQAGAKATPLHLAANQGHADAIKALVAAGASDKAINAGGVPTKGGAKAKPIEVKEEL
jgi:cytohesin